MWCAVYAEAEKEEEARKKLWSLQTGVYFIELIGCGTLWARVSVWRKRDQRLADWLTHCGTAEAVCSIKPKTEWNNFTPYEYPHKIDILILWKMKNSKCKTKKSCLVEYNNCLTVTKSDLKLYFNAVRFWSSFLAKVIQHKRHAPIFIEYLCDCFTSNFDDSQFNVQAKPRCLNFNRKEVHGDCPPCD